MECADTMPLFSPVQMEITSSLQVQLAGGPEDVLAHWHYQIHLPDNAAVLAGWFSCFDKMGAVSLEDKLPGTTDSLTARQMFMQRLWCNRGFSSQGRSRELVVGTPSFSAAKLHAH